MELGFGARDLLDLGRWVGLEEGPGRRRAAGGGGQYGKARGERGRLWASTGSLTGVGGGG
jgi:hypothetical protein